MNLGYSALVDCFFHSHLFPRHLAATTINNTTVYDRTAVWANKDIAAKSKWVLPYHISCFFKGILFFPNSRYSCKFVHLFFKIKYFPPPFHFFSPFWTPECKGSVSLQELRSWKVLSSREERGEKQQQLVRNPVLFFFPEASTSHLVAAAPRACRITLLGVNTLHETLKRVCVCVKRHLARQEEFLNPEVYKMHL